MIYLGDNPIGINIEGLKLIHSHTISKDYTTTLAPLYTDEIKPYITYGDYHKLCIVVFRNNTSTLSNPINVLFFSLGIDIEAVDGDTRNGGIIRQNYNNIRRIVTSYDARCSAGTQIYIYEYTIN